MRFAFLVAIAVAATLVVAYWVEREPDWCVEVREFCSGDLQTERESDLCLYIDQRSILDCKTGYELLTEGRRHD